MFPTEKELSEMFESLMKHMHNQFGKKLDFETEHIFVTMPGKEFRLVLFGNFESWQEENTKLKGA